MSAMARTAPQITRKKRRSGSPWAHGGDNGRVVLVAHPASATIDTADPFDRAHLSGTSAGGFMFHPSAFVRPDGTVGVNRMFPSTPRRYPRSAMTSRGVAHDSMFDDWHEARSRLIREGIALGRSGPCASAAASALDNRLRENLRLRDVLEPRTRQAGMTPREAELERRANEILNRGPV